MKFLTFLIILFFIPNITHSCNTYVVGFRGLNQAFDNNSFIEYSNNINACTKVFDWNEISESLQFIEHLQVPYQLYGFSRGAATISALMMRVTSKPKYIITIGAWHTIDVDFTKYNVKFNNYFDKSGERQKSPGIKILHVSHENIQRYVNENYYLK